MGETKKCQRHGGNTAYTQVEKKLKLSIIIPGKNPTPISNTPPPLLCVTCWKEYYSLNYYTVSLQLVPVSWKLPPEYHNHTW